MKLFNKFKKILPKSRRKIIKKVLWKRKYGNAPKIFGIGNNKTGTTSLKKAMEDLGYKVGDQRQAELLHREWAERNFKPIIEYCKTAEFFQDFPFSKPFTYVALDQAFPNSKFIITIRDDAEQWYNSLTKFHSKLWGKNGRIPTQEDLRQATYITKGRPWEMKVINNITPDNDPYNKELLIKSYESYNASVMNYFSHRPHDLLILNVSEKGAYRKLCKFLKKPVIQDEFPWENKTAEIKK